MYIEEISLEGFKSYAQRTLVQGFDPKFNAITGLNGSGKSNILDSICFVLGITNLQQVRAGSLQELVYKQGQAGVTRATVSIVFNNSDKSASPVGFEDCDKITVTRQIVIGGRNKYLINGHVAQPSRVQNLFHSVQLNVNNPHFLIMQGRITKVLNMKPPEILSMLEEAAGTRMYEVKKEGALKTLDKKQTKLDEINKILSDEILPALEKLRRERAAYQQWLQGTEEIDRLKRFCIAYEYVQAVRQKESSVATFQAIKDKVAAIVKEQEELERQGAEKQQEVTRVMKEKERKMGGEMKELMDKAEDLLKGLVKLTASYTSREEALKEEEGNKKKILASMKELREGTEDKRRRAAAMDATVDKARNEADEKAAELKAAEDEFEAIQAGKSGHPGEDKSMAQAMADAKTEAVAAATEVKQLGLRIAHMEKELAPKKKALSQKQQESSGQQKALDKMKAEMSALEQKIRRLGHDEAKAAELDKVKAVEEPGVQGLRQKVGQLAAELGVGFSYRDPAPNFDRKRVKGVLARLFGVRDPAMATALEVVAGGKLYNVVIDSEQTGKQLLTHGNLQRRHTFIPLNKIDGRSLGQATIDKARRLVGADNVWPALSLVEYDDVLEPAMKYVFGKHFVCRDSETAKKVAFHPDIMTNCVTLDGDSYNPGGTVTGGSRRGGGVLLARVAELRKDEAALAEKEANLTQALRELANMESVRKQYKQVASELEIKTHKLALLQEQHQQSEVQQLAAEVEALEKDLESARQGVEAATKKEKELKAKAVQLEKDIERMGREKGQRLKQLEARCKQAKKAAVAAAKALEACQADRDKAALDLQTVDVEEGTLREQLEAVEAEIEGINTKAKELELQITTLKAEHGKAEAAVESRRQLLRSCDDQLQQLEQELGEIAERKTNATVELKKLEHQAKQREAEQQGGAKAVERLLRQHEWIATERAMFGRAGSYYDFNARDPVAAQALLREKLEEQSSLEKRVNKKVMAMFERAEQECRGLEKRRETVLGDKNKIRQAIAELDEKKKEALKITWEKVTKDFGAIFSTLLPGTTAKLEPPEGEDFLAGLEVKVAFGGVWKESLSELSGGQRSLLALSLILALLLFKPAPLYILDEVDAALDLSHTQNIGRMIKNHFPHSQFVVVSLKEGMFNNANVIFRTKFVDGVSTVTRTVQRRSEEASDQAKSGKGSKGAASFRSGHHKENVAPLR